MDDPNLNPNPNPDSPAVVDPPPAKSWLDTLPDDLKSNQEALAPWKDKQPADVLKSHLELEGKLKNALIPPGENATDAEKAEYTAKVRQASGVPETADGYKLTLPDVVPADDPVITAFKAQAWADGMPPAMVQNTVTAVVKAVAEYKEGQRLVGEESIKAEFGAQYPERMDTVLRGFKGLAADAGVPKERVEAMLANSGLKYNPDLVKIFEVAGKHYSEDGFKGGGSGGDERTVAEKLFPREKMGKYAQA